VVDWIGNSEGKKKKEEKKKGGGKASAYFPVSSRVREKGEETRQRGLFGSTKKRKKKNVVILTVCPKRREKRSRQAIHVQPVKTGKKEKGGMVLFCECAHGVKGEMEPPREIGEHAQASASCREERMKICFQ